jgi:mRNA interferase RelE/StbE
MEQSPAVAEYDVRLSSSAAKEFHQLPQEIKERARKAIDSLRATPRPPGVRKIAGKAQVYRIRVGVYRIVYEVDDEQRSVHVTVVRHRREAYR